VFILAEARAGSSGTETLGLEQWGPRGEARRQAAGAPETIRSRALESILGLGLPTAEFVLRPGVLQLQLPLLSLWQGTRVW